MQTQKRSFSLPLCLWIGVLLFALAACQSEPEATATPEPVAEATEISDAAVTEEATEAVITAATEEPSTPTEEPTLPPPPSATPLPTSTPVPATDTPEATATETVTPTVTASPTSPPQPTRPPVTPAPAATRPPAPAGPVDPATLGENILPNPSFEEGHHNQDGIPELQLPVGWRIEYDQGNTGFGDQAWDVWVRPETRVLSTAFLPPAEHGLYIFEGSNTVKVFKGAGAISVRLLTDMTLQPGTYVLEVQFFSDVFEGYENGQKIAPINPDAAEVRLIAGGGGTNWQRQNYLQKNVVNYTFTVTSAQTSPVGIGLRGRYAIANNGWFLDNFSLRRVQ